MLSRALLLGALGSRGTARLCRPLSGTPRLLQLFQHSMRELRAMGWLDERGELLEPPEGERELLIAYFTNVVQPTRRAYAWGIPTVEAIALIRHYARLGVVEVGAGTGYWASLLASGGVDIVAYDEAPVDQPALNGFHALRGSHSGNVRAFSPVACGGPTDAARHTQRALLLVWPPSESEPAIPAHMASLALDTLRAYQGDTVFYVGYCSDVMAESQKSQVQYRWDTAGPAFEQLLRADFEMVASLCLPNWPPAADSLSVWKRRHRNNEPPHVREGKVEFLESSVNANSAVESQTVTMGQGLAGAPRAALASDSSQAQTERDVMLDELRRDFDWLWLRWRWSTLKSRGPLNSEELKILEECQRRANLGIRLALRVSLRQGWWTSFKR